MRLEMWIFGSGTFFFFPMAVIYGLLSSWEPVGFAALLLTGFLSGMIGLYFALVSQRIDARPEDDPAAEVAAGAGEVGFFDPGSWWPLALAAGAAVMFLGIAVGLWMFLLGLAAFALAAFGLVFEHYAGDFRH